MQNPFTNDQPFCTFKPLLLGETWKRGGWIFLESYKTNINISSIVIISL